MEHLQFFFYIFSLFTGLISVLFSLFIFSRHKKQSIVFYIGILVGIAFVLLSAVLKNYLHLLQFESMVIMTINSMFAKAGHILLLFSLPLFIYHVLGLSAGRRKYIIFLSIVSVSLVIHIVGIENKYPLFYKLFNIVVILSMCIYTVILMGMHFRTIEEKIIRNAFKMVLFILVIFIPYVGFDLLFFPHYRFSLPLLYCFLNLGGIFFLLKYYTKPSYYSQNKITAYFCKTFEITQRELEIMNLILSGLKNKEISNKLFVSLKTVESHIYNIFKKTGVSNRIQLINLVQTNRKEGKS